jgi:hypothetical protein
MAYQRNRDGPAMTVDDHDDVYKLAARLRALTLADRMDPMAVLEIAGRLEAIGDQWAADETTYAQAFTAAREEIDRLRGRLGACEGALDGARKAIRAQRKAIQAQQ